MSLRFKRNIGVFILVLVLVAGGIGFGYFVGQNSIVCEVCAPEDLDFSLFWEALQTLRNNFVDTEKIDDQEIIYGAISGMVGSLGDPYSVFLNPEDNKMFLQDIAGRFEGVGMEIGIRNNSLQVIAPLEGTPAQRAGLRSGDKIIKVNEELTAELSLDQVVSLIRGPKGTTAKLTIFRDGWDEIKDIEIVRAVITVPSLKWEMLDNDMAYIKIYHFSEKAGLDFSRAAIEILANGAQRIIVDLRNNPGGYLEIAKNIASFFLNRGEIVVIEDSGESKKEFKTNGTGVFLNYPTVILINQGSASGSEILAGALRDNRGIILIGENSFGKGSVQQLERLSGGSSLKITTAKWLTPKGETIADVGLEPDIVVEMTNEDYENDQDPQLDKAIEIIKDL